MSKARDKALEAFPISFSERMGYKSANLPNERRNAFEKGYEQAINDAMQWFTDHLKHYIDYDKDGSIGNFDDNALLEGFDRAMR